MNWTVPVETIKTVQCIYCGGTGDAKWAELHLAEKQYWRLPASKLKNKRGTQFVVIEKVKTKHCSSCDAELKPVFDADTDEQFDDALPISFGHGYGMYFDDMDRNEVKGILCKPCAKKLIKKNPWMGKLIRNEK